jgi:hypothetical protein
MVVSFIGNDLQLFVGGSCLINDICVCLHILASNTCYIVSFSTDRASLCQDKNVYTCYVHFFVCKHYLYCSVRIKRIALNMCCHSLCPIQSANILSKWNMFNSTTIGSCLINDICVCLHILASNTCYIVSLFCLSSSCVRLHVVWFTYIYTPYFHSCCEVVVRSLIIAVWVNKR